MNRSIWAIVAGIILVLLLIGACAFILLPLGSGYGPYGFGMMGPGMMMGGFGFPFLGGAAVLLFGAFILVGIVLLIAWLAQGAGQSPSSAPHGESALEVLKARYAKGEITREQYQEMRHDLE